MNDRLCYYWKRFLKQKNVTASAKDNKHGKQRGGVSDSDLIQFSKMGSRAAG